MVRVLVADPHPLYREAVARAIDRHPRLDLVGRTSDGRQALAEIARLAPEVAVLGTTHVNVVLATLPGI